MFRTVPLSIIRSFSLYTQQWYMSYRLTDSLRAAHIPLLCVQWKTPVQDQDGSCSQAVSKPVWHIPLLCVQWKYPDDGQRNCPKHVEFHSKNKFEKLCIKLVLLQEFVTMHGHMNVHERQMRPAVAWTQDMKSHFVGASTREPLRTIIRVAWHSRTYQRTHSHVNKSHLFNMEPQLAIQTAVSRFQLLPLLPVGKQTVQHKARLGLQMSL